MPEAPSSSEGLGAAQSGSGGMGTAQGGSGMAGTAQTAAGGTGTAVSGPGDVGTARSGPVDESAAARLVQALGARGWTLAVAESLTGGMVTAAIVDVPGASKVLRGGVVAYATDLKATALGVDAALLRERGPVDPQVAEAMARGVRQRLAADVGLATTGVAGPGSQDGHPSGEVYVAVVTPSDVRVESLQLDGDRSAVREGARRAVLACAVNLLAPAAVEREHPASR